MSDCNKQRSALRDRRLLTPPQSICYQHSRRGPCQGPGDDQELVMIFICSSMCRRSCSSSSPSSDFLLLSSSSTAATPSPPAPLPPAARGLDAFQRLSRAVQVSAANTQHKMSRDLDTAVLRRAMSLQRATVWSTRSVGRQAIRHLNPQCLKSLVLLRSPVHPSLIRPEPWGLVVVTYRQHQRNEAAQHQSSHLHLAQSFPTVTSCGSVAVATAPHLREDMDGGHI
ncbi:hypothetical protein INR49_013137 [Caranx melampygus]|nr:hypothetical protein INR49_013137 [Caranx melampygus]